MVFTTLLNAVNSGVDKFLASDASSKKQTILIGSGILGSLALLAVGYKMFNANANDNLAPALTEEETRVILTAILDKVKLLAAQMVNAAQNIKQQIESQGQSLGDKQIMSSFILPHFTNSYREAQSHILSEYDVEEYELEDAVKTYMNGDEKIKEIVSKIRKLFQTCGGDIEADDEEAPEGGPSSEELSLENVIEILQSLSELVSARTDDYIIAFKEKYGVPEDKATMEAFQSGMMSLSESAEATVTKQYGITQSQLEKALMQYSNRRELQEVYFMMQHSSSMKMQSHGMIPRGMQ